MDIISGKANNVKIAYIGGGSRGWARGLMSDLALQEKMSGHVYLFDIDYEASKDNAIIGNMINNHKDNKSNWNYFSTKDIKDALIDSDFVVISILPGTFNEMESDVHEPENYGIYQSVGDSVGPGGIVRAMRTIPMYEIIAKNIEKYCPKAWVINYTNPMTICTQSLYEFFPQIKAFGCCHEVFGTQELIANIYNEATNSQINRYQIDVNIYGINHFTWINEAKYQGKDLLPMVKKYSLENKDGAISKTLNWMNKNFASNQAIKFDLFKNYGVLAAAGDRHLAEFCPGNWYLKDKATVEKWKFSLTSVEWRKKDQKEKIEKTKNIINGKELLEIIPTGEEGVNQMIALLGLDSFVTNVNLPNKGQIPNLPLGAVVETNAYFSGDSVVPLFAGEIPSNINNLIIRHIYNQKEIISATINGDYERVFKVFLNDPNMQLDMTSARELFNKMLYNTKDYLPHYDTYMGKF